MSYLSSGNKEECYGCRVCEQICDVSCITMKFDSEGFLYPVIDQSRCIDCRRCQKYCPYDSNMKKVDNKKCWAFVANDKDMLKASSSGAAFAVIAKEFLSDGGIVFGCRYSSNLKVKTVEITNVCDLYMLQNSKYVQCDTELSFSTIKERLQNEKKVLYCSTPCQIAALKSYLGKEYDSLYLIDLICHGVPSQKIFDKYITYLEKKDGKEIKSYCFRDKSSGGEALNGYYINTSNHTVYSSDDPYYYAYLHGSIYRPSCYSCRYASCERQGDLTLGDFWGVKYENIHINTKGGVSAVITNTRKGFKLFDNIRNLGDNCEVEYSKISKYNTQLREPMIKPKIRDILYSKIDKYTFDKLSFKYLLGPRKYIKSKIMGFIKHRS